MRATDRQAAGARVRRSNSRAARPASAIKTARKLSEIPPGEEVPLPDSPPGAVGSPGAPRRGAGLRSLGQRRDGPTLGRGAERRARKKRKTQDAWLKGAQHPGGAEADELRARCVIRSCGSGVKHGIWRVHRRRADGRHVHRRRAVTGGTFTGGVLTGGVLTGGTFTGGVFTGGTFTGGVLTGGTFTGGVLTGGTFTGGVLTGGVFTGGMFTGGVLTGGTFTGGVLTGGTFTGGVLTGGTFTGGVLTGGTFTGGVLTGGVLDGRRRSPAAC